MRFDSSDKDNEGHVSLPEDTSLANPESSAMTISVWLKSDVAIASMPPKSFASILNSDPAAASQSPKSDNYILYYDGGRAELRAKFTTSAGEFARPGVPAAEVPVGKWYHAAAVYDGTKAAIYLDGVKKGELPLTGKLRSGQVSAIGRKGTADQQYWTGDIDDLAIWTRALTPSEIKILAAGGSPLSKLLGAPPAAQMPGAAPLKPASSATAEQKPTLYFFYAPTHEESRTFYESVIRKNANFATVNQFTVIPVNIQTSPDEAAKYKVFRTPTFVIKKPDGTVAWTHSGIPTEDEFLSQLKRHAR